MDARPHPNLAGILLVLALGGCVSGPFEATPPQRRAAELYPAAQERHQVVAAVDALAGAERAKRQFGAPLPKADILAVNIIITNRGDRPVRIGPKNVLLEGGGIVADRVPLNTVTHAILDHQGRHTRAFAKEVRSYLEEQAFRELVLAPGRSYRGTMFFTTARRKDPPPPYLFGSSEGRYTVRVMAVTPRTGRTIEFVPFPVAVPEDA
ncbi:hypothetical protein [Thiohalorhabdus methylotrophus]|uniref:DUF4352 domain-containing protein n=1 Tax=Thiohalorhabdus methylotrophus TaxID=3242694 RepID=A0ABV4TZD5_9GAMM